MTSRLTDHNFPTLKTDRLLLRGITDFDLKHIFKGLSHPDVIRYYGISFDTLEATQEQMAWFADEKQMWWAICSPDNQTFYGAGGLNAIDYEDNKAEIGFWLLPQFWGKGIMKEALPLISDYGLNQLQLNRIEGFIETENINCIKAITKLDFRYEKTIQDYEIKNGKSIHVDVYIKTI
ncbi:ribosomal-protein-alanine N-acetyltransferase [Sinomicrobium oceani]|uniref:Ribosomal-protein-alanine N-acetyltransferase n=1 Tax=Sinomicrobium oceani TaxID=1150368 RepID=A0A1K1LV86_9FLAO|nr:GNAT family N-acetyltransferase [Sinomicrobium oceani]SFW14770.1 ribosomal-protein-alanine N-acetyltransferase [Sinomicrobium oceani]